MCIFSRGCADYGKGCALSTIEVCKQQEHTEPSLVLKTTHNFYENIYELKEGGGIPTSFNSLGMRSYRLVSLLLVILEQLNISTKNGVNDIMTIWTQGNKIFFRIKAIFFPDR